MSALTAQLGFLPGIRQPNLQRLQSARRVTGIGSRRKATIAPGITSSLKVAVMLFSCLHSTDETPNDLC